MADRDSTTRQRLLAVACGLLAEKGYRQATVTEICRRADANIAAVSYHFGGKEKLYVAAWEHAHRQMLEAHPPDGGVPAEAPPAQRLEGRIRALVRRALDERDVAFRIGEHEMANPTGLLRQVVRAAIAPLRRDTAAVIAELLGPGAYERTVRLCSLSVIAPIRGLMHRRRMRRHLGGKRRLIEDSEGGLVEHFTAFAFAGIDRIRRRLGRADGRRSKRLNRRQTSAARKEK